MNKLIVCVHGVALAGCRLQGPVDQQTRRASVGICVVVAIGHAAGLRNRQQKNRTGGKRMGAGLLVHGGCTQSLVGSQRLRQLRCGGCHWQNVRRAVAEGNAKPSGQQNGKHVDRGCPG